MSQRIITAIVPLLLLLPARTFAQVPIQPAAEVNRGCKQERTWEGLTILVDQDVFWPPAFDQDYTMGIEFVARGCFGRKIVSKSPLQLLDGVFGLVRRQKELSETSSAGDLGHEAHSVSFGNTGFTPSKAQLAETAPLLDDRPYANLMYLKVRRAAAKGDRALVTDFTLGILGLRVGETVQKRIHKGRDITPGGWPNQISDGGELTAKYRVSPRWLLVNHFPTPADARNPWGFDLSASVEGNAGYYTNVSWGMSVRAGLVRSHWWAFERHAIADVRRSLDGGSVPFVTEAFVWASGGSTAWLYNGLLQGQFRESKAKLSFSSESPAPIRRVTGDAQIGATVRLRPLGLGLTYGVQWLTPTFGGPKNRIHSWGGIYLSFQ